MVNMIPLDEHVLVAAQIQPDDLADIAKTGVTLVVNNRPDGEALMWQPNAADVEAAAHAAGIDFLNLPFTGSELTPEQVAAFAGVIATGEGRVLAYCRSGSRSSLLWAAARVANGADIDDVLARAQDAGIDLSQARAHIESLGKAAATKA